MPDLESWIEPYFRDSSLWPVLLVALAIGATLLGSLILLAAVDRQPTAMAALVALVWMSGDATRRQLRARRRLGLVGGSLLSLWALAGAAALAARLSGLY